MDSRYCYINDIFVNEKEESENLPFMIDICSKENPKHLILTGRNGSGKTHLLSRIGSKGSMAYSAKLTLEQAKKMGQGVMAGSLCFQTGVSPRILGLFLARRAYGYKKISKPEKLNVQAHRLETADLALHLSQILVNFKVDEALAHLNNQREKGEKIRLLFERVQDAIREVVEEPTATIEFDAETYSFSVRMPQRVDRFENLPSGFSAAFGILFDLFIRQFEIERNPSSEGEEFWGTVLIDEPEVHLHLELQYRIMPILEKFFPNIQFIVATHSPAVASSLRNAVVFDLSTKKYAPSNAAGMSFTELMEVHFGVENEFGPEADELLKKYKEVYLNGGGPKEKREKITKLMEDYEDILTPVLRLEMESIVIRLESEIASI